MTLTKCWCTLENNTENSNNEHEMEIDHVFANHSEEEDVYPSTVCEIAEEQLNDEALQKWKETCNYEETLIENTLVLCKNGKLVIPKMLQHKIVAWYHHYLQHPGHTRLEETLKSAMYWPNLRKDVQSYVKTCKSCQVNKHKICKYGNLPTKQVIDKPLEYLCVDLVGPYP